MKTPNLGLEPIIFFREEGDKVNEFWDLLRQSTIGQIALALLWGGLTAYLLVTGQPVPGEVWGINGIIVGFFFGAKLRQKLGG